MAESATPIPDEAARSLLGELGAGPTPPLAADLRFEPLDATDDPGRAAAVDAGQTIVVDLGTVGVVALRAGYTIREAGDGYEDVVALDTAHAVSRRTADEQWRRFVAPYAWGRDLEPPLAAGTQWVHAWLESERAVAEMDAALRALRRLRAGDLLLLDGSLDNELPHADLMRHVADAARREGVHLVGVTKDTGLSFGGILPFTLELEEAAQRAAAPSRFFVDATRPLARAGPFHTYGVRMDPRSPVYRVDVARDAANPEGVLGRILALANDVAYPGYPYPLARIHQRVHYAEDEALDLKRQLEGRIAERRGSLFSLRLFGRGRDVLALGA